ncbi:hypothetical protein RJ639_022450 [Escallonia herrerae]|uniref:Uncharacterized protein n=1 Tax=Escallonia herrerae TaxID=1293975 RepID=A0AA88V5E9_9ASTE|nr:hypothetical protein RJ639_022450 [Escallonia herrerae]
MSERQRLCFFVDGLQQWVATELRRREPHELASAMAIVERFEDFKQRERQKSPRHNRTKDSGDSRSKSGSLKATDDERSEDEGHRRHYKRKKKHQGSHKRGDSCDHKVHRGIRRECLYCAGPHYGKDCPHKEVEGRSCQDQEEMALLYPKVDVAEKTQEALMDTGATHNFMSPWVDEWLGLKSTKDGSWFTFVNAKERLTKGVIKNVDLRIDIWIWKANFNIIDMDELGVVLEMDFMKKSSNTLNLYCGVMMMVGKEGQLEWMIPLMSKDGADARKGIIVLQLDNGSMLCYDERQMGPMTYTIDMLTKIVATVKFKHCLSLIHFLSC